MKPSHEDMHSMLEGAEVFVDLGVLVVEGRVPGGVWAAGKGYGEGSHCAGVGIAGNTARHDCDPANNIMCKRAEKFRKHMQLLWQNNIPMCIEVLLCPDCPCGAQRAQCTEVSNMPAPPDILLEQWMITAVTNRVPESPQMTVRGLFQAVRSQLHFSQLAAWWSNSKGSDPVNVSYRVTVSGEAFSSNFKRPPLEHSFPVAFVTRNTAINVSVRTLPRMEKVPMVVCTAHPVNSGKQGIEGGAIPKRNKSVEDQAWSVSKEQPDQQLTESLLDPPPSLDLFARRFQSPSRCGSPSMEAPEYLMFGRGTHNQEAEEDVLWRERSPPSRVGRHGLVRRRDSSITDVGAADCVLEWRSSHVLPALVDDRLQNPCNLPGKHHCRCAFDDDLEITPLPTPLHSMLDVNHQRHLDTKSQSFTKESSLPSCSKPISGKVLSCQLEVDSVRHDRACGLKANSCNEECSEERTGMKPSAETLQNDAPGIGCKFNLELSRQEFEEVLAVLRDRNAGQPVHPGTRKPASPSKPGYNQLFSCSSKSEVVSVLKPPIVLDHDSNVVSATTSTISKCSDKADILMGAILRSSIGRKEKATSLKTTQSEVARSVLNENRIKCKHKNEEDDRIFKSDIRENLKFNCDSEMYLEPQKLLNTPTKLEKVCDYGSDIGKGQIKATLLSQSLHNLPLNDHTTIDNHALYTNTQGSMQKTAINTATAISSSKTNKYHIPLSKLMDSCDSEMFNVPFNASPNCNTNYARSLDNYCDILHQSDTHLTNASLINKDKLNVSKEIKKKRPKSPLVMVPPPNALPDHTYSSKHAEDGAQENWEIYTHDRSIPSALDKAKFRRSFDSAASMVFHSRTGLPLTSSPAPVRRGTSRFDFDSSLNSVSAIRSALFETGAVPTPDDTMSVSSDDAESEGSAKSPCSPGVGLMFIAMEPLPWSCSSSPCSSLLGSFEESVLNGRLEPVSTVQGFTAELGASGSFCPRHRILPVTVFFYTIGDNDKVSTPYLGHINLGKKGYHVPRCGTIQVTLFNPLGTVIKMFVVMYDLTDMPASSQTFLRQRTLYMPAFISNTASLPDNAQKWLRYLIHLRFSSSKSGRIHLHSDIRMIIFRKSDLDTATAHGMDMSYELRSFTHGPTNPKFSSRK